MSDFLLEVKVKNGKLLKAMREKGIKSGAELAKICNTSTSVVCKFLALTETPIKKNGDFKDSVIKISEVLGKMPVDIFPRDSLSIKLDKNKYEIEMSMEDVRQLSQEKTALEQLEEKELNICLNRAVETLTEREQKIINYRYGIGCEPHTLHETGRIIGVSGSRIRQIENRAIKKLRHPLRIGEVKMLYKN